MRLGIRICISRRLFPANAYAKAFVYEIVNANRFDNGNSFVYTYIYLHTYVGIFLHLRSLTGHVSRMIETHPHICIPQFVRTGLPCEPIAEAGGNWLRGCGSRGLAGGAPPGLK